MEKDNKYRHLAQKHPYYKIPFTINRCMVYVNKDRLYEGEPDLGSPPTSVNSTGLSIFREKISGDLGSGVC